MTPSTLKKKKIIIPGGKDMLEGLQYPEMEKMFWNMLKFCFLFDDVRFSFSSDPDKRTLVTTKAAEFQKDPSGREVWVYHEKGKRYIAQKMAEIVSRQALVAMDIKPDGIYVHTDKKDGFTPRSKDWGPYIEFSPKRVGGRGEYAQY